MTTSNYLKGGDFMARVPIEGAPASMIWEGGPLVAGNLTIRKNQRVGEGNNTRHPERVLIEARQRQPILGSIRFQQVKP